MITGSYLGEIRARCEGVRDLVIEIADGSDGRAKVLARRGASVVELRVMRDGDPAGDGDVLFIGHVFSDIPRLLEALETGSHLSAEDVALIRMRIAAASPGPWTPFIESEGGIGGSDVIRVSESDSEADMSACAAGGRSAVARPGHARILDDCRVVGGVPRLV